MPLYIKTTFIPLVLLFAIGCEKPELASPPLPESGDKPDSKLELVWKVPLASDEDICESREPMVYQDKLICNSAPAGSGFTIWLLDGKTGQQEWSWNSFIKYPTITYSNHQFIEDDKYIINNGEETHVIDLNSGNTLWQSFYKRAGHYVTIIDGYIYHKHNSQQWPTEYQHLVRSPINYVQWDTILSLDKDNLDGYSPAIFGPTLWMSPSNDSILVFQNRSWRFGSNQDGQIDLYGYNLSKEKVEFIKKDIEPTGNSNVLPPVVEGDRVYVIGNRNLHCIDLVSREFIWQKGFPGSGHHLMLSNLIIDGNRLIVKPDNDAIYAFDKYTGELLWNTYEAGYSPSHMKFYNGMVFYTAEGDGKLFAVSTSNGQIVWREDSPNDGNRKYPSAAFQNGVAINEQLGYIYAQDKYFMLCFKLPE